MFEVSKRCYQLAMRCRSAINTVEAESADPRVVGRPFVAGQSGNPRGRAKGSRNRFSRGFIRDLVADFELHGRLAIEIVRRERPVEYLRIIAALLPQEVEAEQSAMDDLTDRDLAVVIGTVRHALGQLA